MRLIVGMSGASGAIYGIRLLETLRDQGVESHLVISGSAQKTIELETNYHITDVQALASRVYDYSDLAASISSGSFLTDGMVVIPCAIKSLAGIAHSYNDNLLIRAADVCLKERRRLVLVVRETPLHIGHLKLMLAVAEMGGVILPPVPAFYHMPKTLADVIGHTVGKVLDHWGLEARLTRRWSGVEDDSGKRIQRESVSLVKHQPRRLRNQRK